MTVDTLHCTADNLHLHLHCFIVNKFKVFIPLPCSGSEILHLASKQEVLKILECPICLEVPFPPIYNCNGGHIICNVCRPKLTRCALCKAKFSKGRNRVAESIVLSSRHSCKYREDGCFEVLDGYRMPEHVKTCPLRLVGMEYAYFFLVPRKI